MYMKRRLGKLSVILSAVIFATAAMSACKKDDISEIDRTFEYTRTETQTTSQHETDEQKDTTTEKESTVKESTKETTGQTQEETTTRKQLTGAAVYFEDKKSVFNTLPSFTAGKFEEYFSESYVEGLKFSGAKESDYSDYLKSVINEGKYTLNSQDGTRAYLAAASGKMCITLIYKDGTMLIEAGENYWDILTYAEPETQEPTKPSESADGRYAYFDNKDSVFSQLPYMTAGNFTGYESVNGGGIMTFSVITSDMVSDYGDILESNGFMFSSSTPDGLTSYYVNDKLIVTVVYDGSVMKLQVVSQ
jgi:lipoprotein